MPTPQRPIFGQERHQPCPPAQPPIGHGHLLPPPPTTGERQGRLKYLLVSNRPKRAYKVCTQLLPPYLSESERHVGKVFYKCVNPPCGNSYEYEK